MEAGGAADSRGGKKMGIMDKDKRILFLKDDLQHAMQKIKYQSDFISSQSSKLSAQLSQIEEMRQKILIERKCRQEQEVQLQKEIQKNRELTRELEELRQKERRLENERREQAFQRKSAMWTRPEWQNRDGAGNRQNNPDQTEQERVRKKSEFELLVKQQQDQSEPLAEREQWEISRGRLLTSEGERREQSQIEQPSINGRNTQGQNLSLSIGEQNATGKRERIQASEESGGSKKQLQQELMECSKNIRDMQRVIKELYQFKPCRQLCQLLVNIRQNVFNDMDEIQEDLAYVAEAFGVREFQPKAAESFDPKCHEQVRSNVLDARGKEIDKVYSSGFEVDGEVIVKAQVSIK